jgi:hypothetical protein
MNNCTPTWNMTCILAPDNILAEQEVFLGDKKNPTEWVG